jgi:hypothetical protein
MEAGVRVEEKVTKTIVFIGQANGPFIAHGTGFLGVNFIGESVFQQIVTARHVIDGIPGKVVHVRINRKDGEAELIKIPKEHWFFHPSDKIDVAISPTEISKDQFDIMHIPLSGPSVLTEEIIRDRFIGTGDEIFVAGMFVSRLGETKNLPIIRSGTIAAMPEEKIRTAYGYHHAYLIEARSIDGLSGSPVHVQIPPFRVIKGEIKAQMGHVQYLLGVLLGHGAVTNPSDTIEILQPGSKRAKAKTVVASIPLNTGIGVVLPIVHVIETVEQPWLNEARISDMKKPTQRQFVADSAVKSGPSTKADNPSHKEDFTRLLRAATAKRQSDGQT